MSRAGALLVDLGDVPAAHCDTCLDDLFKAIATDPRAQGDRIIWRPHDNPYLTWQVEDVTRRLQAIIAAMQDALARILTGQPIGELQKAAIPGLRWSAEAMAEARRHLESLPPAAWTLDDYMLLCDFIIQTYLPEGVIDNEADYLTVRATLTGKIAAAMESEPARRRRMERDQLDALAAMLPSTFRTVPPKVLTELQRVMLTIARTRTAEAITAVTDAQRHRLKQIVLRHLEGQALGQREGTVQHMRQELFDSHGELNRDFRRIAVTESGEAHNTGYVGAQRPGTMIRRIEAYQGACEFCRSINGKTFKVVAANDPDRNGETDVWVGKTNIGRSASPRKRSGNELVPREPDEMWWVAAGVQHPHCRGAWQPVPEKVVPGVDPDFLAWMDQQIAASRRS